MQKEAALQIVEEKLKQLEEAQVKNVAVGNLNFGVHLNHYTGNPHYADFMKKKKLLTRFIIIDSFFIALMMVGIFGDVFDKVFEQPLKGLLYLLVMTVVAALFFVYFPMRSLVVQSNNVQTEIKKMMLEDIKQKIEALP